jgi:SAM-dependent methyltransferase
MSERDQAAVTAMPHGGENLEVMANAHNYNRYLCDLVSRYSHGARSVVDFGAGIGTFSACLDLPPENIHCVETEPASRQECLSKGFNAYSDVSELPEASIPYIFSLNVLEHIEDDAAALRDLYRTLEPGGWLFVYVPAFQILYTSMDAHVGHHRRYRISSLVDCVKQAGFEVERSAYTDALGYFATLVFKIFDKPEPAPLNAKLVEIYDRFLFPLSRLMSVPLARVLGKNVFVVARKPLDSP